MKSSHYTLGFILFCFALANGVQAQNGSVIWKTDAYSIHADGVKQHKFAAKAVSPTELTSNYQSPVNESVSSGLTFKFSINGKDNEMKSGVNHYYNFTTGNETPLIRFGELQKEKNTGKEIALKPDSRLKIRLDMRDVLKELKNKGYYTTFSGEKIFKEDFKNVYIAGATAPMVWDFDNLYQRSELQLRDEDGDGIYETTLTFNAKKDQKKTEGTWQLTRDLSAFPQYKSDYVLTDAIYNLSTEEMLNAVEADSTFRTGKEWAGVWTRDISYSIILSMAYLQPKVAMNSLMKKVNANKRIIQDTGTGGAYPASTDRMVWAIAAYEVYKATGDKNWLQQSYTIVKNSIEDDLNVIYDKETHLVRGESSFLDWREQTYPKWMQPADIFESENLGTNAVHFQANVVLAEMATLLNFKDVAKKHKLIAANIKMGINEHLWLKDKGYYAQYLYGRNSKIVSPRAEALGEALCVLYGIADLQKQQSIVANTPVTDYGISCIYPQIPNIPPYHNNAVWPFVQAYWGLASAKTGNVTSVMESMAAIIRPSALFLTNKENFVADNGDFAGTQINSSNMLWSLAGNLAMTHKILFGMDFQADKLVLRPFVPQELKGTRTLSNFKYREAILEISVEGYGNTIKSFTLDGKVVTSPEISQSLKGPHTVKIVLDNMAFTNTKINKRDNDFSPAAPSVSYTNGVLSWNPVEGAVNYSVLKNGKEIEKTAKTTANAVKLGYAEYQVIAADAKGVTSFASEPIVVAEDKATSIFELENSIGKAEYPYKGYSGNGFIETSKTVNPTFDFSVAIGETGWYAVDFHYANGNGPTNTENKCAIRTLKEGITTLGTFVFPQRGVSEWSNWGFSNPVKVYLTAGKHVLTLKLESYNENMNSDINQAMLDYIRIVKLDKK